MAEGGSNATRSAIWAVATLLIVVLVFTILYFGGVLSNKTRMNEFYGSNSNAVTK